MKVIKSDEMRVLAEICMEETGGDVMQSFKDVTLIDDLLNINKMKSLLNTARGRKTKVEKRFSQIFRARFEQAVNGKPIQ